MATDTPTRTGSSGHDGSSVLAPNASPTQLGIGGAVLIPAAVLVATISRQFNLGMALLVLGVVVAAALLTGHRSFVHFFGFVMLLRPLVDLSAGPRSGGLALTEVFGAGVLLVTTSWLLWRFSDLRPRLSTPLGFPLVMLFLMWCCSTMASTAPGGGVTACLRLAAGMAVYFATDVLLSTGRMTARHLAQLLLAVSAVPLLYPLLGLVGVTVTAPKDDVIALKSVFFLSNNFGYFLVPMVVLGTAWALWSRGTMRYLALAYTAVAGLELLETETRGAWACAALGMLVVCVIVDRRVAAGLAIAMAVLAMLTPTVRDRIDNLGHDPTDPRGESSLDWRFGQWEVLTPLVASSPVIGHGPGAALRATAKEPHNDYLKMLVENGAAGLMAYLWFLGAALYTSWSALLLALRRVKGMRPGSYDVTVPALCTAVAAYTVAVVLGSFGDNLIDNVTFLWSTLPLLAFAQWARIALRDEPHRVL